jgi:hypothetical protein
MSEQLRFGEVAEAARGILHEVESAGAVVTGRRTAELMDHWGGDLRGGGGRRLFEELTAEIELEIVRVVDTPEATHLRYRVKGG